MVSTDFKVSYQGSLLGYTWSVLRPLLLFTTLYIVFTKFLKIGSDIPHYPVYLLLGIVLWSFFGEATNTAMTSVVSRGDLIKKISIPRYLVVVSGSLSAIINLGLNLIVVGIFAAVNHLPIMKSWVLLPILIIELFVFAIACGFFLSALFVKYRDASYVWEVLLQAGFYATPILYPLTLISSLELQKLLMLNPMAQIIQDSRWALVSHQTLSSWKVLNLPYLLVPFVIIIASVAISIFYFKKQSKYFAENI
jgi:ABC-2 type transport system permease protein